MLRLFYFLVCICSLNPLQGQLDHLRQEVDKIITNDTEVYKNKVPGFSIGIVDGDSIFYLHYESPSLTDSSIYEIGSTTKVFMATLVEILVQEGTLSYSEPINSFLPPAYRNPRMEELIVSDLIYHQSGLPKLPQFFGKKEKEVQNPYAYYTKEDLLQFYAQFTPKENEGYSYSHCNYALLEVIIERRTKQRLEFLINKHILDLVGMSDSFLEDSERSSTITPGHDRAGRKVRPWTFSSFIGSEGMKSSVRDLSCFLQACMSQEETTVASALNNTLEIGDVTNFNKNVFIAKAWHIVDQGKNYQIVTHSGNTSGHHCLIAFVKETRTGIVVLSNSAYGTEDLGFLILRMINYNWKRKA